MKGIIITLTGVVAFALGAASYLTEFESFDCKDPAKAQGWGIANGNGYVQFHGKNAEIMAKLQLPETGDYYVWVRAWAANDTYRKADLTINGKKIGFFGDGKPEGAEPGFTWRRSRRRVHFDAGGIDIRAVGQSPYTRFDAMILTTGDEKYSGKVENLPHLESVVVGSRSARGNVIKAAPKTGKGAPMLVFCGMRPWMGADFANIFARSGAQVTCVNGPYLDGLGGAPIKQHMVDKVEPRPFDGITPAFEELGNHRLVVFHLFKPELLEKLLTPERIARLKTYVENGGHVLFTRNAPRNCPDIMPVTLGDDVSISEVFHAGRPSGTDFESYPETLPVFGIYREAEAVPGAEVLSTIRDGEGDDVAPYIVRRKIGRGSVTFFNAERSNPKAMKEYGNWVYGASFFASLAGNCAGVKMDASGLVRRPAPIPERKTLGEVSVDVRLPKMAISQTDGTPKVSGNTAVFADGARLVVRDGRVDFYLPEAKNPLMRDAEIPRILTLGAARSYTSETAEAVGVNDDTKALELDLRFNGMSTEENEVVLRYVGRDTEMSWRFVSGRFDLDGRTYLGYADRVRIEKCPALIGSVEFSSKLCIDNPLFARRFSCYMSPRGYTDADMSGRTDGDTQQWCAFASGQPFEYVAARDGVYLGHISAPFMSNQRLSRKAGADAISDIHIAGFGRLPAPVASPWYWHWYGTGPENGHNEYIAIYQYMRHSLRRQAGLAELPAYPHTEVSYRVTDEERNEVYEKAAAAGYRFMMRQNPESPVDKLPDTLPWSKEILAAGMRPYSWSAGSYVQGRDGWVYKTHPEWFARDQKGAVQSYFSTPTTAGYPVIDINNREFQEWYRKTVMILIDGAKLGWIYRDMDGTASGTVNFALPQSPNGMNSQIGIYRFFHDHDCRVGIEGQNPLVIDQFWYRAPLYTPMAGKEFAMIGTAPWCDLEGGVGLD
ncbi:MAG: hypothetical protein MJ025_06830, partial [Victivallaceae bacterium]|nr:hypothetical protein [Victivallaceae bacterium]